MHTALATTMKLSAFEASANIHGTQRTVVFLPGDGVEQSALVINGLTLEDAIHVLTTLEGGLLKGADAAQPEAPKAAAPAKPKAPKPAEPAPAKEVQGSAAKPPAPAVVAPAVAVAAKPTLTSVPAQPAADDDDLDGPSGPTDLDVAAMAGMAKLREVIEHMRDRGHNTPELVVKAAQTHVAAVPELAKVLEKAAGDGAAFAKRMERAALVVFGGAQPAA